MLARCPRCDVDMDRLRAQSAQGRAPEVDVCPKCRGLWLDGDDLVAVCPTLSHLPERRFEMSLVGKEGAHLPKCPRCARVPHMIRVLEVCIDFCTGCCGVWLDGDEYSELDFVPVGRQQKVGSPYRAKASRAVRTGLADCERCEAEQRVKQMFVGEQGLLCRSCFAQWDQRRANRRAEEFSGGVLGEILDEVFGGARVALNHHGGAGS